jgi:REP element-mobilizing transposase RayT
MGRQQSFVYSTWGGVRAGAGRKPSRARAGEEHAKRPEVVARYPVHLTMKVAGVPSLRAQRCMTVMRAAFRGGRAREGFRLVQYAVQPNHIHLIVEADDKRALSGGARGLAIRVAMRLNAMLRRRGRVFSDRYHAVELTTARQTRNALAYVLLQERRHRAQRGAEMTAGLDACSSAPLFDGFTSGRPRAGPWDDTVVAGTSWLLTAGWRREGAIDPREIPGLSSNRRRR